MGIPKIDRNIAPPFYHLFIYTTIEQKETSAAAGY